MRHNNKDIPTLWAQAIAAHEAMKIAQAAAEQAARTAAFRRHMAALAEEKAGRAWALHDAAVRAIISPPIE
jgi:hypothetical protein